MDSFNTQAIIDTAKTLGRHETQKPETKEIGGVSCLVTHSGAITPLVLPEKFLNHPKRKRARVELFEALSFIRYLNRHKIAGRSHVFGICTETAGVFNAILDYHDEETLAPVAAKPVETITSTGNAQEPAGQSVIVLEGRPHPLANWGEHTVKLTLATTPEWTRWLQKNGQLIPQADFAEFIEENQLDIVEPDAGVILDVAQQLQGKKTVNFRSGKKLSNGQISFEYTEEIQVAGGNGATSRTDGSMVVPDKFKLRLVPFIGALGVEIEARLRFRIGTDGKLSFAYLLNRPHLVIEQIFKGTRDEIEKETGLSVLMGSGAITPGS